MKNLHSAILLLIASDHQILMQTHCAPCEGNVIGDDATAAKTKCGNAGEE